MQKTHNISGRGCFLWFGRIIIFEKVCSFACSSGGKCPFACSSGGSVLICLLQFGICKGAYAFACSSSWSVFIRLFQQRKRAHSRVPAKDACSFLCSSAGYARERAHSCVHAVEVCPFAVFIYMFINLYSCLFIYLLTYIVINLYSAQFIYWLICIYILVLYLLICIFNHLYIY